MANILIVDDTPEILKMLDLHLSILKHDVTTALTAEMAIVLCRSFKFDIIICDALLPGMDGHGFAKWLASTVPTPIVLMSGAPINCEECPLDSKCHILAKPFLNHNVSMLVDQVLKKGKENRC